MVPPEKRVFIPQLSGSGKKKSTDKGKEGHRWNLQVEPTCLTTPLSTNAVLSSRHNKILEKTRPIK
jgi:hypothetical protein